MRFREVDRLRAVCPFRGISTIGRIAIEPEGEGFWIVVGGEESTISFVIAPDGEIRGTALTWDDQSPLAAESSPEEQLVYEILEFAEARQSDEPAPQRKRLHHA